MNPNFESIKPAGNCGLYVHIPFCLKKCSYCDFVITTQRGPADKARFLEALQAEINHATQKYGRLKFNTLYLGGGTPSALDPQEFSDVFNMLQKSFDFEKGFEFTVEVNPGDIDDAKIKAYQMAGVNRVSLGVQAFQEHLLKDMNRPHGVHEVVQTVEKLHQAGLTNISMDMIVYLPGQTVKDVEETLQKLLELKPNQISVYDLDVHEKTAYGHRQKKGKLALPSEEEHALMSQTLIRILEGAGFKHYELSNFSKPGFESRHNLIYWHNQPYLGLGPGAFSYMNGVRYQFASSVDSYVKKTLTNDWKNETEDVLTPEEIEKENILTGLRLKEGFDLNRLKIRRQAFEKATEIYLQEGLLEKDGFRLKFTPKGKPVAEVILKKIAQV